MTPDEQLASMKHQLECFQAANQDEKDLALIVYALIHQAWTIDPDAAIEIHNHFMQNVVINPEGVTLQ